MLYYIAQRLIEAFLINFFFAFYHFESRHVYAEDI